MAVRATDERMPPGKYRTKTTVLTTLVWPRDATASGEDTRPPTNHLPIRDGRWSRRFERPAHTVAGRIAMRGRWFRSCNGIPGPVKFATGAATAYLAVMGADRGGHRHSPGTDVLLGRGRGRAVVELAFVAVVAGGTLWYIRRRRAAGGAFWRAPDVPGPGFRTSVSACGHQCFRTF